MRPSSEFPAVCLPRRTPHGQSMRAKKFESILGSRTKLRMAPYALRLFRLARAAKLGVTKPLSSCFECAEGMFQPSERIRPLPRAEVDQQLHSPCCLPGIAVADYTSHNDTIEKHVVASGRQSGKCVRHALHLLFAFQSELERQITSVARSDQAAASGGVIRLNNQVSAAGCGQQLPRIVTSH